MRFKIQKHISYGDERLITQFLLFPKTLSLNDGSLGKQTRWLETSTWREIYKSDGYDNTWFAVCWND